MRVRLFLVLLLVAPGCEIDVPIGTTTAPPSPRPEPIDILFVVDNSGSMCEEQLALREAVFGADCPIQDLTDPGPWLDASPEEPDLAQRCGLAQLLAAADVDFRLGFLTTDVGACDNRYGFAETQPTLTCRGETVPWGRRPQRGCLQAGPSWDDKWLSRADPRFSERLAEGLAQVGVFGSPFERGLDAVDVFLDPAAERAPGCERDAADFLRPDAHLVLVFVTDEDDCSHRDGLAGLPDENEGDSCANQTEAFYTMKDPTLSPDRCYTEPENLAPVRGYADDWLARTAGELSVFVLGGIVPDEGGVPVAASCLAAPDGTITTACTSSWGASNLTGPGQPCAPEDTDPACCTADAATRYLQLGREVGRGHAASICGDFDAVFKRLNVVFGPR